MSNRADVKMQDDVESVRARLRGEHRTLRGLLALLTREAATACAKSAGRARVRLALTVVRDALTLHLDDEEREVVSRLRTGHDPSTVTRLANAHEAFRASVTALVEDAEDGSARNVADLAEEIAWFVKGLERDMDREETELLTLNALAGPGARATTSIGQDG